MVYYWAMDVLTKEYCLFGLELSFVKDGGLSNWIRLQSEISKIAEMSGKNLYVIAGCNGAGKTTAASTILPEVISCDEFVNADEIARGISPFNPESVSIEAGRLMLIRIDYLMRSGKNFAFETTLAGKSHLLRLKVARRLGYRIMLLFFWLQDQELAKERVRIRVLEGGHGLDPMVVERRYAKGMKNLFGSYLPIADSAFLIDNSAGNFELIAQKILGGDLSVYDLENFKKLNLLSDDT